MNKITFAGKIKFLVEQTEYDDFLKIFSRVAHDEIKMDVLRKEFEDKEALVDRLYKEFHRE